jgi:hypothetical protein
VKLCETLQQRWQACRARVYGEEMVSDFKWCNLWGPYRPVIRPCTSPRRSHCRSGGKPTAPQGWTPKDGWFQMPWQAP